MLLEHNPGNDSYFKYKAIELCRHKVNNFNIYMFTLTFFASPTDRGSLPYLTLSRSLLLGCMVLSTPI